MHRDNHTQHPSLMFTLPSPWNMALPSPWNMALPPPWNMVLQVQSGAFELKFGVIDLTDLFDQWDSEVRVKGTMPITMFHYK